MALARRRAAGETLCGDVFICARSTRRISRARAYAKVGRYDYAQTDLTSVLTLSPNRVDALRYRADAHLNQGNLTDAKRDIERALNLDPSIIETAVLRGRINEAIRKAALSKANAPTTPYQVFRGKILISGDLYGYDFACYESRAFHQGKS